MSEEVKTPEQGSEDTRVKINPKDAATSMLPAGLDANNLTPEQQMNYTSTMVKASRLHEKAIDGLSKEEEDVFNALLIVFLAFIRFLGLARYFALKYCFK